MLPRPVSVSVSVVISVSVSVPVSVPSIISIPVSISIAVIVCIDLVANDATDHGPADRSNSATIRQDGACDATDAGADRGILVLS